jgi:tetratricopeptide (TPR) repeat protein
MSGLRTVQYCLEGFAMSARGAAKAAGQQVKKAVAQAKNEYKQGNYRRGVELLQPFVGPGAKKLTQQQERDVVSWLSQCYRVLDDYKAAFPHAQRGLELTLQLYRPRSQEHAYALEGLCLVQTGLEAFLEARANITEALAIMDGLGLQKDEAYGGMLSTLGGIDLNEGLYREALLTYSKAKSVLVQYKKGSDYAIVLHNMARCHEELLEWNEAIACYREAIELDRAVYGNQHPEYAVSVRNLAGTCSTLKRFDEAVPLFEEALPIYQRVYGDKHVGTVELVEDLAAARQVVLDARQNAPLIQHKNDDLINLVQATFRAEQEARGRLYLALEQVHASFRAEEAHLQRQRAVLEEQLLTQLSTQREEFSALRAQLETQGKRLRSELAEAEGMVAVKREKLEIERECGLCKADEVQKCCLVPCGHVVCNECAQQSVGRGSCPFCRTACQSCMNIYPQ